MVRYKTDKPSKDRTLQLTSQRISNRKNMYRKAQLRTILNIGLYRFRRKFTITIFKQVWR